MDISRVIEALPEPAVLLGTDGSVAHFNPPAVDQLGVTGPGQAPPWTLLQLDRSPLPKPLEVLAREGGALVSQRVLLKGRRSVLREFEVRALPLRGVDGAIDGILLTFFDVSAEPTSDLQEYHRYFELSDDCLCVATPSGVLLRVNEGATRLLGRQRDELLGNGMAKLTHPDDLERTRVVMESRAPAFEFVNRLRHVDGSWRLLSWTLRPERSPTFGEVTYLRAVDVTEKLRREEELMTSRELLAEAQDIANIATVARDYRTGELDVAPRLRRMLGVPEGATIEQYLWPRLGEEARSQLADALARGLRGEPTSHRLRVELPRGTREFKVWARPRRDARGEVVRLVGVVQDVTEEMRLGAQLRLAERMASVGTLAAGVAHEINNPLAFIVANLNSVRSDLARVDDVPGIDFADLKAALVEASEGAERVRDIVAGLRAFTHIDDGAASACDVVRVLEAVLNLSRNETRHRARVVTHFEPVPSVMANEARLGQVFLNLVLNAAQAIPDGHVDENQLTVSTRPEQGRVVVTISDTGSGIAPEHLPRIFDPFFTTRVVGSSTGLGLFIAQGIVRELAGELLVDSRVGHGTTFTVRLPTQAPAEPKVDRARLLVVDDEPLVVRSLERMLRDYQLTTASTGEAALALLQRERFDLVLCDVNMPGLDGVALWRRLAPAQRANFVFVTGGASSDEVQDFLDHEAPRVLTKPFRAEVVQALVKEQLAR
jgi:PAS domain S-box-containing protein